MIVCKYFMSVMFLFSLCCEVTVLTFLVRMNAVFCFFPCSVVTFFSHLQFVESCLCWFYITSLRLPTIRFQRFEQAGSPPLKLPLIPTMWQNTGLVKTPTWQELFLFFGMPSPRYRGVGCAQKLAKVRGQNAIDQAKMEVLFYLLKEFLPLFTQFEVTKHVPPAEMYHDNPHTFNTVILS